MVANYLTNTGIFTAERGAKYPAMICAVVSPVFSDAEFFRAGIVLA